MAVSLRSLNFPDRFIRHRNFLGELTQIVSELDREDATFDIGNGAVGSLINIRPGNFPFHALRHQDFRIKLQEFNPGLVMPGQTESPEAKLLREDATFRLAHGLADPRGISFASVNFPDRFIRHRDFHLFLEPADSDLARRDATFFPVQPFVPDPPPPPGPH